MKWLNFRHATVMLLAFTLLASLAVILSDVYSRVVDLRSSPRDNTQWVILQAQSEYLRVRHATSSGHAELKTQFDVYYARLSLLETAPSLAAIRSDKAVSADLRKLLDLRDTIAQLVDEGPARHEANRNRISNLLEESQLYLRPFLQSSIARFAKNSDEERLQLAQSMLLAGLLSTLLVVALIATVIFLRQRTKEGLRRERLLHESKEWLKTVIHSSLDATAVLDSEGSIMEWNPSAQMLFGINREDAIGRKLFEMIMPAEEYAEKNAGILTLIRTPEKKMFGRRFEIEAVDSKGDTFPAEMSLGFAPDLEMPVNVVHMRDLTDHKNALAALAEAAKRSEAANLAKANFLAVMSHEMRTPLNGVIGTLDLLAGSPMSGEQRKLVAMALLAGEQLLAQINDVLDFSKMEASGVELEVEPLDIGELVSSVIDILTAFRAENGNIITGAVGPALAHPRQGDSQRLRQILLNLGSNAMKFTEAGDISIRANVTQMGHVRFEVSDTGIGIPEDKKALLFREFSVLDSSLSRSSGGTGLGLAICKRLVESMGGQIGVDSQSGSGSTFWFEVPLPETRPMAEYNQAAAPESEVPGGLHVLLVEDNRTNQFVAQRMLENMGCHVRVANNGSEALDALLGDMFDVVLMDISMPVMDGLEAIARIRSLDTPAQSLPVIAMTANAVAGDRERFLHAGFSGYVSKPVRQNTLAQALSGIAPHAMPSQSVEPGLASQKFPLTLDLTAFASLAGELGPDILRDAVNAFHADIERHLGLLRKAVADEDTAAATKATHAIAGVSSTLGAIALSDIASSMEVALKSQSVAARDIDVESLAAQQGLLKVVLRDQVSALEAA